MQVNENIRILVVDDADFMRKAIKKLLEDIGFSAVFEAKDGVQALSELKSHRYDVLISDWNMPNLDGISLVRMIRSDASLKDMKVLMVTAEAHKEQVEEAIKVGVSDYIVKPFTGDVLHRKMDSLLGAKPPIA